MPKATRPICHGIDGSPCEITPIYFAGGEVELDIQVSTPLIYPQQVILFDTDDLPTQEEYLYSGFFNNFFDAIDGSYCSYSAYGEIGNSPIDPPYPDSKFANSIRSDQFHSNF